jgi:hypothetical protein
MKFKVLKEYEGTKNVELEDVEIGSDQVTLKWDGCVDYQMGSNGIKPSEDPSGENTTYIHICDIDEFIEKLQALKAFGKKHFDNEYWK